MKKILLLLVITIVFVGCEKAERPVEAPIVENIEATIEVQKVEVETEAEVWRPEDAKPMFVETIGPGIPEIVQNGLYDSCYSYALKRADGSYIDDESIDRGFECPFIFPVMSSDYKYLVYMDFPSLRMFDFETEESTELMSVYDDSEGGECLWAPDDKNVVCVFVNQQRYDSLTKFFVLGVENGKLVSKDKYSRTVDYVCGGLCYPDQFWFKGNNTLEYMGHSAMENPQQVHILEF
jgi:hypothetical protein